MNSVSVFGQSSNMAFGDEVRPSHAFGESLSNEYTDRQSSFDSYYGEAAETPMIPVRGLSPEKERQFLADMERGRLENLRMIEESRPRISRYLDELRREAEDKRRLNKYRQPGTVLLTPPGSPKRSTGHDVIAQPQSRQQQPLEQSSPPQNETPIWRSLESQPLLENEIPTSNHLEGQPPASESGLPTSNSEDFAVQHSEPQTLALVDQGSQPGTQTAEAPPISDSIAVRPGGPKLRGKSKTKNPTTSNSLAPKKDKSNARRKSGQVKDSKITKTYRTRSQVKNTASFVKLESKKGRLVETRQP